MTKSGLPKLRDLFDAEQIRTGSWHLAASSDETAAYRQLPEFDFDHIRYILQERFYDYVRSGLLLYHRHKYWFEDIDVIREGNHFEWHFLVFALSPEQIADIEHRHQLFREMVGTYWDFDEQGKRLPDEQRIWRSKEVPPVFWEAATTRPPLDLSENDVVGWFRYSLLDDEDEDDSDG